MHWHSSNDVNKSKMMLHLSSTVHIMLVRAILPASNSCGDVVVFLLAIPVHGLVHVVAPGPVRGRAGAHTRAAGLALARAPAPTPRAHGAALAATAARALAPDTEVLGKFLLHTFFIYIK